LTGRVQRNSIIGKHKDAKQHGNDIRVDFFDQIFNQPKFLIPTKLRTALNVRFLLRTTAL